MQDRPQKESFWKTVPGMLTAAASFITAVGGFILIMSQVGVCNRANNSNTVGERAGKDTTIAAFATKPKDSTSLSTTTERTTYTVLQIKKEEYSPTETRLVVTIKADVGAGNGGLTFSAEYFRLEIDGIRIDPATNTSNRYVPENAQHKGDVSFIVAKESKGGTLWVGDSGRGKASSISLTW